MYNYVNRDIFIKRPVISGFSPSLFKSSQSNRNTLTSVIISFFKSGVLEHGSPLCLRTELVSNLSRPKPDGIGRNANEEAFVWVYMKLI